MLTESREIRKRGLSYLRIVGEARRQLYDIIAAAFHGIVRAAIMPPAQEMMNILMVTRS